MPVKRFRPGDEPEGPSLYEQHEAMVKAGDVRGLVQSIQNAPAAYLDIRESYRQLQRAIDIACRTSAETCAEEIFQMMTAFSMNAMIRVELECLREMNSTDATGASRGMPLSSEFLTHWLPLKQQLDLHLSNLQLARASTMRQLALVKRHHVESKAKPPAKKHRKPTVKRQPKRFPRLNGFHNRSRN